MGSWPYFRIEPDDWRPFMGSVRFLTLPVSYLDDYDDDDDDQPIHTLKCFAGVRKVHFHDDFILILWKNAGLTFRRIFQCIFSTWRSVD